MSFGFSIGDFIALAKLVEGTRKRFKGAPAEYAALADETRTLQIVINDLTIQIEDDEVGDSVKANLQSAATNCESVLVDLNTVIDSHTELAATNSTTTKPHSRMWKRMKWDPAEVSKLRSRLISAVQLMKAILDSMHLNNIAQEVKTLTIASNAAEIREIADWIAPAIYSGWQNDYFSKVQPGTGQWILSEPSYLDWRNGDLANLFFDGHPGVGKTFLASMIINDLQDYTSQSDTLALAFFYNSFSRHETQSSIHIISSLLRQLFLRQPEKAHAVKDLFTKHQGPEKRPSWDDLCHTLESTLREFCTVYFVIDALDECDGPHEEGGQPWQRVFKLLFHLQAALKPQVNIRILATFRPFVIIDGAPENHKRQRIEASDHDLETFCRAFIPSIRCIAKKPELHSLVIQEVCDSAQGMFLVAYLHCDTLSTKTKPKDILSAIRRFKKGGDPLPRAYEDSLRRIQCQPEEHRELARKILICVTFSFRPLSVEEIRHAVAVDRDTEDIDPEYDLDDPDLMISVCAGLVTLDMQNQNIRMVHYTMQTFLESLDNGFLSSPHTFLASCCLSYLKLSSFATGHHDNADERVRRYRQYPFYIYSAQRWAEHWEHGGFDETLQEHAFSFLDNSGFVASAWVEVGVGNYHYYFRHGVSSVHLLALMGANVVLKTYLGRGYPPRPMQNGDIRCKRCKSTTSSHIDCLESKQRSWQEEVTNLKDDEGCTAMVYAAAAGHLSTMEALHYANEAIVNETNGDGNTVLTYALNSMKESVVLGLLQNPGPLRSGYKIDVNYQNVSGTSALMCAASRASLEIVKLLTSSHNADVDSADENGKTPIMWAAIWNRPDVVTFLAPLVSDINRRNKWKQTVVHLLVQGVMRYLSSSNEAWEGWEELRTCFSCLVKHGADLRLKDANGMSAYDILCEAEADPDRKHWAAERLDNIRGLKEIILDSLSPSETLNVT